MSGDPVLTQLPPSDSLGTSNGVHLPFQPLQSIEAPVFKSNGYHRGNRPHGNGGFPSNTSQSWGQNHRSHFYGNHNRGSQGRNNNNRGVHNNTNHVGGNKGNKGNRTHNAHAHGNQHHTNPQYKRHDYSAQNNPSSFPHSPYCPPLPNSVQPRRRHSNDSIIHSNIHGSPIPGVVQPDMHPGSPVVPLPRSPSYESGIQHPMNFRHGPFHSTPNDMTCIHGNYIPQHQVTHPSLDALETGCNLPNSRHTPAPELAFQQPIYVGWGFLPQNMPPMVQQGTHMSSHPSSLQGQDDMGSDHQASPLQIGTPTMSAGAHDQVHDQDRLREQLEWYLSPKNLATDSYLVTRMNADHWVPISVLADFKKVKAITSDINEVVDALRRSSKVVVDEYGTMVRAITADRPRTTLILRDLPEDVTQEEIADIFSDAQCAPKSVTKEVGNMWYVEFATAKVALDMLLYTRGRYLHDVPIAARLKSNTLLTGGEYKAAPPLSGGSAIPTMHGWSHSPPDTDHEIPFGVPMPYRRFPADESYADQETWTSTSRPGFIPHVSGLVHHYLPGTYLPPNLQGPVPFVAPANPYYINNQMWVPAPAFAMPPQESGVARIYPDIGVVPSSTHNHDFGGGLQSGSDTEFRAQYGRTKGVENTGRRGEGSRRGAADDGVRQNRNYSQDTTGDFVTGTDLNTRSDRSSDRSEFSSAVIGQGINKRKPKKNAKKRARGQQQKQQFNAVSSTSQDSMNLAEEGARRGATDITDELTTRVSKLTTEDRSKPNKRRGNSAKRAAKLVQTSPSFGNDNFPPLPSCSNTRAHGDSSHAAQQGSIWMTRPAKPIPRSFINHVDAQESKQSPQERDLVMLNGIQEEEVASGDTNHVESRGSSPGAVANTTSTLPTVVKPSEDNRTASEEVMVDTSEDREHGTGGIEALKGKSGNGGFSYASALKAPLESVAPTIGRGTASESRGEGRI